METINIEGLGYREINEKLRGTPGCRLAGCAASGSSARAWDMGRL